MNDDKVRLILNPKEYLHKGTYSSVITKVTNNLKLPSAEQILLAISRDIIDTNIVIPNISNRILGNIAYGDRSTNILNYVAEKNGHIEFNNSYFNNLSSDTCYWTSTTYKKNMNYAIKNNNEETIKLYGEDKNNECLFVPIIEIIKEPILNE